MKHRTLNEITTQTEKKVHIKRFKLVRKEVSPENKIIGKTEMNQNQQQLMKKGFIASLLLDIDYKHIDMKR